MEWWIGITEMVGEEYSIKEKQAREVEQKEKGGLDKRLVLGSREMDPLSLEIFKK